MQKYTGHFPVVGNLRGSVYPEAAAGIIRKSRSQSKAYVWTFTGLAWDHLSRPVDVCVGMFPAVCAKPVQLDSHVDQSIAMTRRRADQVHGDTEY